MLFKVGRHKREGVIRTYFKLLYGTNAKNFSPVVIKDANSSLIDAKGFRRN